MKNIFDKYDIIYVCICLFFFFIFVFYSIDYSFVGYRYYAYISGDENHTCYEDTIIWGSEQDVRVYARDINKTHIYNIEHFVRVNRFNAPTTKRITINDKQPVFINHISTNDHEYTSCNKCVNPYKLSSRLHHDIYHKDNNEKKNTRKVHIRMNGNIDVGGNKTGNINYNIHKEKLGIRSSKYTVIDEDGIHFSY